MKAILICSPLCAKIEKRTKYTYHIPKKRSVHICCNMFCLFKFPFDSANLQKYLQAFQNRKRRMKTGKNETEGNKNKIKCNQIHLFVRFISCVAKILFIPTLHISSIFRLFFFHCLNRTVCTLYPTNWKNRRILYIKKVCVSM